MLHPQTILQASQHLSTSRLQISLPETWISFYSKPKPSFFKKKKKKKNIEKSTSSGRTRNELLKTLITARVRKKKNHLKITRKITAIPGHVNIL